MVIIVKPTFPFNNGAKKRNGSICDAPKYSVRMGKKWYDRVLVICRLFLALVGHQLMSRVACSHGVIFCGVISIINYSIAINNKN